MYNQNKKNKGESMAKHNIKCTARESEGIKGKVVIKTTYTLPKDYVADDVNKFCVAAQATLFHKAAEWIETHPVMTILAVTIEPNEAPSDTDKHLCILTLYFER